MLVQATAGMMQQAATTSMHGPAGKRNEPPSGSGGNAQAAGGEADGEQARHKRGSLEKVGYCRQASLFLSAQPDQAVLSATFGHCWLCLGGTFLRAVRRCIVTIAVSAEQS